MNKLDRLGDNTTHSVVPDFDGARGYYWMKQTYAARKDGWGKAPPRAPRRTLAERSFFECVDRRLSRSSTSVNIAFDSNGKRIKE